MTKILVDSTFAQNIKRIRLAHGLTQEKTITQIQLLGSPLSRSTYSLIEMGRGNIYINDLVALKMVFGVEFSDFFKDIHPGRSHGDQLNFK